MDTSEKVIMGGIILGERTEDYRYVKTQHKIYTALIALLKKRAFDDITVRDLCQAAQVSRSGFYLHFVDKYDLVDSYGRDLVKMGMQLFYANRGNGLETLYTELLTLINEQGDLITLLLSRKGSVEIQNQIKNQLRQNAADNILPYYGIKNQSPVAQRYLIAMTTGAVLSILQEWLDSGKQESPAELVAVMQEQVMPTLQRSQFRL